MSTVSRTFFIQASNVHCGGGLNLLIPLLQSIDEKKRTMLLIDSRAALPKNLPSNLKIYRVPPTLLGRWRAEYWLQSYVKSCDLVLCFGNLPPLFRLNGEVIVYVQNRYLIDKAPLTEFTWKVRLRLTVERAWLLRRSGFINQFYVQTASMQRMLAESLNISVDRIKIMPFCAKKTNPDSYFNANSLSSQNSLFDFIYPASGDPHKNHRRLIDAWCLLAQQGFYPRLLLTVDKEKYPELSAYLADRCQEFSLKIENDGFLEPDRLFQLYSQSKALIYPSLIESYGLPLLEASLMGLPILAGELDYVRDVVHVLESFDPMSPISIARAIRRYLGFPSPVERCNNAQSFLASIFKSQISIENPKFS